MMRPFTIATMLMAAGSGLYLYQAKHHAEIETQQIAHVLAQTDTVRQQIAVLVTDYQLENDPERLRDLTTKFLPNLHGTEPTQFTSMADLDKRLPPVGSPAPSNDIPLEPDAPADAGAPAAAPQPTPAPTIPIARAEPPHDASKSTTAAAATDSAPQVASRAATLPHPAPARPLAATERVTASAILHAAPSRPHSSSTVLATPVASPVFAARGGAYRPAEPSPTGPMNGSLLGMARPGNQSAVTFSAYQSGGGGG